MAVLASQDQALIAFGTMPPLDTIVAQLERKTRSDDLVPDLWGNLEPSGEGDPLLR